MARNKFIKPKDVVGIASVIRTWSNEKINWEDVCAACEPILGYVPTRQGLNGHQPIKDAFQARKKSLKVALPRGTPMPSSLAVASHRITRLNATVEALKEENDRLRDRLVMWQYNAYKRGLNQAQLEEAMPIIDRERNET
jgi:hypothetical protein